MFAELTADLGFDRIDQLVTDRLITENIIRCNTGLSAV